MIVEFIIEFEDRLLFDKDCAIVETYYEENGYDGYDIMEVEVDDLSEIKITIAGKPHVAATVKKGLYGRYYVDLWKPIEE